MTTLTATSTPRRRGERPFLRIAAVIGAVVIPACALAGCGASAPSAGPLAGLSAATVLQRALGDANRAGSVQYQVTTTGAGIDQHVNGVWGPNGASVTISSSSGQSQIIVKNGTAYIRAGASELQLSLGVTAPQASPLAGKWVAVRSTQAPYAQLEKATALSSTLAEFTPGGQLRTSAQRVAGHSVVAILGTGTGSAPVQTYTVQLAVTEQSSPLPIAGVVTIAGDGKSAHQQAVFSAWGKAVTIEAPVSAVAFAGTATG